MDSIVNSYYTNNAIKLRKMVDKILIKLKFHDVDNEDFYSLANEIFAAVDTGYVSQNIYLAAQANGLGTCAMGSIADRKMLIKKLDLGKNVPLLVHPVGVPE